DLYECDTIIKPSRTSSQPQKFFGQIFDSNTASTDQQLFLQSYDRLLGYNCNFNTTFNLSFFPACHSQYDHKKNYKGENSDNNDYDNDNYGDDGYVNDYVDNNFSSSSSSCLEIKAKINLKCIDDVDINKDDIKTSYKVNGHSQEMALKDNNDYDAFIVECKKLNNSTKHMDLIEVEDSDEERVTKKSKTKKDNRLPRKSRLSHDEVELAKDNLHFPLTPPRLHLWSRDIRAKITNMKTPPTYPTFGLTNALKSNTRTS
ncbi:14228_t:CDS:2, partial [Cetraspora pellucida]